MLAMLSGDPPQLRWACMSPAYQPAGGSSGAFVRLGRPPPPRRPTGPDRGAAIADGDRDPRARRLQVAAVVHGAGEDRRRCRRPRASRRRTRTRGPAAGCQVSPPSTDTSTPPTRPGGPVGGRAPEGQRSGCGHGGAARGRRDVRDGAVRRRPRPRREAARPAAWRAARPCRRTGSPWPAACRRWGPRCPGRGCVEPPRPLDRPGAEHESAVRPLVEDRRCVPGA